MVKLPQRVFLPPDVLARDLEGEMVLLNLENETYYGLDEVGSRIWQLLAENGYVETALQKLLEEYDVEEAVLRKDMTGLIAGLLDAGLLATEPNTPGVVKD